LLIGDSRVADLGRRYIDKPNAMVFNMGVSGSTSAQWRTFFERPPVWIPKAATVVIWLGVNDFVRQESSQSVARDLLQLATVLDRCGNRVSILDQLALDIKAAPFRMQVNSRSRELNTIFDTAPLKSATVIHIVDLFEPDLDKDATPLLSDGVHLTSLGNEAVWRRIAKAVVATNAD
jgi:lysophospholipase L1-like esterase